MSCVSTYRIYCITETAFVKGYYTTQNVPTVCPNNVAHTVQSGSQQVFKPYNPSTIFGIGNYISYTTVISITALLTNDVYYDNLTVNEGVQVLTNGYKICVRGVLKLMGIITRAGNPAGNQTPGSLLLAGSLGGSGNGGNGGTSGNGGNGTNGIAASSNLRGGGNGGAGGAGTGTAGIGGSGTPPAANLGGAFVNSGHVAQETGRCPGGAQPTGGNGGGGGGGTGTTGIGGGGGGGGGSVCVVAGQITNIGTIAGGYITTSGGAGANGSGTGAAGGGGGGGGGITIVICSASTLKSTDVRADGGPGGLGVNGGANGTVGDIGLAVLSYV